MAETLDQVLAAIPATPGDARVLTLIRDQPSGSAEADRISGTGGTEGPMEEGIHLALVAAAPSLLAAERRLVPLNDQIGCLLVKECCGLGERGGAGPGREVSR